MNIDDCAILAEYILETYPELGEEDCRRRAREVSQNYPALAAATVLEKLEKDVGKGKGKGTLSEVVREGASAAVLAEYLLQTYPELGEDARRRTREICLVALAYEDNLGVPEKEAIHMSVALWAHAPDTGEAILEQVMISGRDRATGKGEGKGSSGSDGKGNITDEFDQEYELNDLARRNPEEQPLI